MTHQPNYCLSARGYLNYSPTIGQRLAVEVDRDFMYLYRWFLECQGLSEVKKPRYAPHISVVRNESPVSPEKWRDYLDVDPLSPLWDQFVASFAIEFKYDPYGQHQFHLTIGNTK